MPIEREERKIDGNVGYTGIRFEDGEYPKETGDHEERLASQPERQTPYISGKVHPEHTQEKFTE